MPKSSSAKLPTRYGEFEIKVWPGPKGREPVVLLTKKLNLAKPILVRIHSECLTGDTFGSLRCDCEAQKEQALKLISESKNGVFIYLRQEGRGIGLYEKIKAYVLQEQGYDTHEANLKLGHMADKREYSQVKKILKILNITKINLLTNNPKKIEAIKKAGLEIIKRVPLIIKPNKNTKKYLETKKNKFKHLL